MAGACLRPLSWAFARGPADPPCASGRRVVYPAARSQWATPRAMAAAANVSVRTAPAEVAPQEQKDERKNRIMVYEEDEEDEGAFEAASKDPKSRLLRINVDLTLWRARQRRIDANFTLDVPAKKAKLRQAEKELRQLMADDPTDGRAYVTLGRILLQERRFDEARQLYSDGCLNTGNANPFLWAAWGYLEYRAGNTDAARKMYDAAVCVDRTHACAWHKWGMLEKAEGNYARARDLWMQGIQECRKAPQKSVVYLYQSLAVMAAELGRVDQARSWFEEGTRVQFGPSTVALWQAWAVMEARQGDPTAVRYLFKRALQSYPRSRYTYLAWAMWERQQGNINQCMALLQRGQALNPTDPAIYQAWALMEKRQGRPDNARLLFDAGLRANKLHIPLWQAWGVMEFEQGDLDRARELFQQGVWADPGSRDCAYVFHAWGVLERSVGNIPLARELFKSALKIDPRNETTWDTWTAMEDDIGEGLRADELRIRRAERQWEFDVPAGFSTRPQDDSPFAGILKTLGQFFERREEKRTASRRGSATAAAAGARPLKQLLPEVQEDLLVEDVLQSVQQQQPAASPSSVASQPSRQSAPRQSVLDDQEDADAVAIAAATRAMEEVARLRGDGGLSPAEEELLAVSSGRAPPERAAKPRKRPVSRVLRTVREVEINDEGQ